MKASEVMTRAVATVAPEASLADAVTLMVTRRISGLPVIGDNGTIVGIVTEGENTPGVRGVVDHLSRVEPISGVILEEPPEN